jgi:hypothetical protein
LRELPEATPASFDPEHLDACFLDEATKVEESTRLAAALALAEETG